MKPAEDMLHAAGIDALSNTVGSLYATNVNFDRVRLLGTGKEIAFEFLKEFQKQHIEIVLRSRSDLRTWHG